MKVPYAGIIMLLLCVMASDLPGKTAKDYSAEIEDKSVDLKELKKNLKQKRIEKEKCLLEEKGIRQELSKIEQTLSKLQRQREKIRRDIRNAERKLVQAEKELKAAGWAKQQWSTQLNREADLWYREHQAIQLLTGDPVEEKLRLDALAQKKQFLSQAQIKEAASQGAMVRWQNAQKQLNDLRAAQNIMIEEQESAKGQKKGLLNSTIGRRVGAEEEIKHLVESAQALEQLITKLGKEKKKSEEDLLERKKSDERKNLLPWPVAGEVVAKFGKSKHPELDTYVISNGIKIKASSDAVVHAVAAGEVIYSGEFRSYGQMVIIDHGGGLYTLYGQLGEISIEEDQKILQGGAVGKVAGNGQRTLYFEVRNNGKPEDPLLWLKNR